MCRHHEMTGLPTCSTSRPDEPAATGSACSIIGGIGGTPVTVTQTIVEEQVVKSRHRVKTYGEVFTPRHMVDRMLDLVREELETGPDFVDKTFLEPAAGARQLPRRDPAPQAPRDREALPARGSGQTSPCSPSPRSTASSCWRTTTGTPRRPCSPSSCSFHEDHGVPCGPETSLRQAAAFLIDTNVVRGDTLTGLDWRGEEIQFSWWNRVTGAPGMVQREPFTLASLRATTPSTSPSTTATGPAGSTRSTRK